MSKKNLLSGRDKELQEMAEQYEAAKAENRTIYLDADDLADLADWYAVHHKYAMATEVVEYGLGIHPDNTALLVEQAYLFLDTQHKEQAKGYIGTDCRRIFRSESAESQPTVGRRQRRRSRSDTRQHRR